LAQKRSLNLSLGRDLFKIIDMLIFNAMNLSKNMK
jgi:hypothetical protein